MNESETAKVAPGPINSAPATYSRKAATDGAEVEYTGSEPLVGLRYVGPDVHKKLPMVGDYLKNRRG